MKAKESFYNRLYELVHDTVDSDQLLKLMGVEPVDGLEEKNPDVARIIDEGAGIIGKFVFVAQHLDQYFGNKAEDSGKNPKDPHTDIWHMQDQLSEVWIEALHSLLAVRVGLVKQGISSLRRCYELSVYGTFFSTTFVKLDGGREINPFVELSGRGLWVKNMRKKLRQNEIQGIEKQIGTEKGLRPDAAKHEMFSNFTRYYLRKFCSNVCDEHTKENSPHNAVVLEFDQSFELKCVKCGEPAISVVVNRPIAMGTMASVVEVKLDIMDEFRREISELYYELSALLHPNNPGHQHEPKFEMITLTNWLAMLSRILRLSLIFYSRGLAYIGYKDEETFSLLERRKYELDKISLKELYFAICEKLGREFEERNPGYNYENDHTLPSYLQDKRT